MPKFSKQTIAQFFKFECDRFLRFQLSNEVERKNIDIEGYTLGNVRPGVQLMQEAGNKWEVDKYNDLINSIGEDFVEYKEDAKIDKRLGVKTFKEIDNLLQVLQRKKPPRVVIEGKFPVPITVAKELKEAQDKFGIEPYKANPDILLLIPYPSGAPLISLESDLHKPEYEIHVIDVKMASEASLKHFTEVTFYAIALDAFIREQGLSNRYRVSAQGLIWPGSHDINEFRNLLRRFASEGNENPLKAALDKTLIAVPYEVYDSHVRRFFKERLIPILNLSPLAAAWHLSSKCQLCHYLEYCEEMALKQDHLSRVPWLNKSQADLLRSLGINTTKQLADNISQNSETWSNAKTTNYQLKADELGIRARCVALQEGKPKVISERSTQLMPNWVDMSIFLTLHFDPGSGITFAIGAKRIYFKPPRTKGDAPIVNERVFIVERVEQLNPDTERNRLIEFIDLVETWFREADSDNEHIRNQRRAAGQRDSSQGKVSVHVFFWSQLEVKQLLRMLERHMSHPNVVTRIELLIRLFPPDSILPPDVEAFKSQPGTIVKEVMKQLVGLPIPHDYTLIETANNFFPSVKDDGTAFRFFHPYGFSAKLNDQLPFERAYELWKDDVFLKHGNGTRYTRDEIYEGLKRSIRTYLSALQQVIIKLRENCGSQLKLKKSPFSAAPPTQIQLPETSRKLIAFNKLNAITHEIENRHKTALPIDEKEARFISIRGLVNRTDVYQDTINELRKKNNKLANSKLYAFEFSRDSRDAKIKEGEFLCCITNESLDASIYSYWYQILGLDYYQALSLLNSKNILRPERRVKLQISSMFQVDILLLNTTQEKPYIIARVPEFNRDMFQFGIDENLLDLNEPMVIDPVFKDFETDDVESMLRLVGGKPKKNK